MRKLQLLKKNHAKLFRRIDIKCFVRLLINLLFQFGNSSGQLLPVCLQFLSFNADSFFFHMVQRCRKRHLNRLKQLPHVFRVQLTPQLWPHLICHCRHPAHIRQELSSALFFCRTKPLFSDQLISGRNHPVQIIVRKIFAFVTSLQRIEQICRNRRIIQFALRF